MLVWAVLKDVRGVSGENSLTAWAGVPFKTYLNGDEALSECLRINRFYKENYIKDVAYVAKGKMTETGFYKV